MRFSIIILSIFIFPFQVFSQFENTGFGLAVNYSYPHSTNYIYPHSIGPLPGWDKAQSAFAYHIDIHTFYKINQKFSIKTGLGFIKNKFLLNLDLKFSDQVTIKRGFDGNVNSENLPNKVKYFTSLNYISLPIGINYKINSKWEIGVGIQNNFLLSAYDYSYWKYKSGKIDSKFNEKRFRNDDYANFVMSAYIETKYRFNFLHFPLSANMQMGYGISNYFSEKIPGTLRPVTMNIGLAAKFKN